MRQVHKPEGQVHWISIKIEAEVHYFVTILEHKVNTQLLIQFIHDISKFIKFKKVIKYYQQNAFTPKKK